MAEATRHVGLFLEEALFSEIEDLRYAERFPTRSATIVALLREALDARKREKEEVDEEWLALERSVPKQGGA